MTIKSAKIKRGSAFFMAAALCLGSTSGVYAMDGNELSRLIEEARNTDISGYTPESCESLNEALAGAQALLEKENVTEEELGAGGMMLQAILENGLVARADKSSLEAVLTESADCTDTEAEGYEVLQNVRAQAQAVLEDGNATQAETDGAAAAVVQAEENLGGGVDKSVLDDLISQAEALDTSGSDEASVQQLKTAIASAKQVKANASATQSMVDKHIQLLQAAAEALYEKTDANTVYDGVYEIGGLLHHATADQVSMGNSALVKPFQLVKKGNDIHLRIECTSLTTKLGSQSFTGYLAKMWYYPEMTDEDTLPYGASGEERAVETAEAEAAGETDADNGTESSGEQAEDGLFADGSETEGQEQQETADAQEEAASRELEENAVPEAEAATAKEVGVESYYDKYDSYNDPKKGTDANVKGQKYPHYITIPVELNQGLVWTKIYVPVMESISAGGGSQYAKLYLDWNDLKQISGTNADKSALKSGISSAQSVLKSLQQDNQGYAAEQLEMLSSAIAAAQAVYKNMNTDQTIVDREVTALTMAVNAVTKVKVDSDKSQLKKAIETADSYLNETDVEFEASTLEALKRARDRAQQVYDNEEASQTEVNKCVTAVDNDLCRLIKPEHPDTVVIFLTANDQESDQIRGYEAGAVDYITKPFSISALQRKIKAMFAMLEHHKPAKDIYEDGSLFLDFSEQFASLNGKPLALSAMEYKMLNLFLKNPKQVLTRQQLLERLWDIDEKYVDEHTLTTSISRIRSKIEADGDTYIKTVYGMGYQWTGGEKK